MKLNIPARIHYYCRLDCLHDQGPDVARAACIGWRRYPGALVLSVIELLLNVDKTWWLPHKSAMAPPKRLDLLAILS